MSRSASMSNMTIAGLFDYDETVFDYMDVPTGIDKDAVIAYIIMNTQELEILYPSAPVMKKAIFYWSKAESPIWEKLQAVQELEYNPLENYDVHNESHDKFNRVEDIDATGSIIDRNRVDDDVANNHNVNTTSSNNGGSTDTHNVAAFNASTAQLANQDINSHNDTDTIGTIETESESRDIVEAKDRGTTDNVDKTRDDTDDLFGHTHGNMGSYSFQELILAEREIREFNIYQYIANSFKHRFCLLVY